MPENSVRPRNRPERTSTIAAMVPSTVATVEEMTATLSVIQAAFRNAVSRNSSPYHLVEKPDQTVTSLPPLKE